jgi:hypothetical protein
MSKCGYIDISRGETTPNSPWVDVKVEDNHICITRESFDSMAIMSKQVYENWFLEGYWDNIKFPPNTFKTGKIELGRAGLLDFGDFFDIQYDTDGEGQVYPDVYDEFEKEAETGKKKKGKGGKFPIEPTSGKEPETPIK